MNRTIRKIAMTAALTLPIALVAQVAQATLITSWNYDVESGFSSHMDDGAGGGTGIVEENPNPGLSNLPTKLSWGEPAPGPRSSIVVTASQTGSVDTNGAAVPGATFTHNNFTIPVNDTSLTRATLENMLTLNASAPPSKIGTTDGQTFHFVIPFAETPNVAGTCPAGSTGAPCDDVFVLQNPSGVTSFTFTEDEYLYTVALDIAGLGPLSNSACAAAGAANGCVGVLTQEGQVNTIPTSFTITAELQTVPEPGALSIMGLGLIGLAFLGLRRNRSES